MRAIVVDGDERLHWQEVEDPTCAGHQVIVDVHASAVNRADLLQRAGHYPPPGAPPYMGLEMCGHYSTDRRPSLRMERGRSGRPSLRWGIRRTGRRPRRSPDCAA